MGATGAQTPNFAQPPIIFIFYLTTKGILTFINTVFPFYERRGYAPREGGSDSLKTFILNHS